MEHFINLLNQLQHFAYMLFFLGALFLREDGLINLNKKKISAYTINGCTWIILASICIEISLILYVNVIS